MKKKKQNIQLGQDVGKLTVYFDTPEPPPPAGFTSPFKTIQEWLVHLCTTNLNDKAVSEYYFDLNKSSSDKYLLSLLGFNKYNIDINVVAHRIDFKPATHAHFALPDEFGNSSKQEVQEQVLNELLAFIRSAQFQTSFLSKGNSIKTNFAGEIWAK